MKTITSDYKNAIKTLGREIDAKITYTLNNEEVELGGDMLNSITPHYEGGILRSVMKQLDIDSNQDIPIGTILECQFGVFTGSQYEYISFGNYVVYSSEKQEDTKSYKLVCYDKMLYSMKDYEAFATYPISVRNYLDALCDHIGLDFASISDDFVNYDREIPAELFLDANGDGLEYTFRDVLDQLAQITASTICINDDDELEVRYINDTNDEIDGEFLKDINVNFGQVYGPINTITFKRSADADAISVSRPANLPDDQKIEIAISDNQFLNDDNRGDYIDEILDELYGLTYSINDFVSTGITYYDLCDKYSVLVEDEENNTSTTYTCIMFNDEINITQGLVENIHTDLPEESETDYKTTTKDDRNSTRTNLIVDKVNNQIIALTSKTEQLEESIEVLSANLDTNVIIVSVDDTGKPFYNKTYEIDYSMKYLGEPLLTGYSVSTSDSHTGITTDLTTLGKLKFSVATNTAITSEDNKYTFTFSYTNSGNTFTSTRTIMLSTLSSDVEQNVVISALEPSDTSVLWFDTLDNVLKKYIDGEWEEVNSADADIQNLTNLISGENGLESKYGDLERRIGDAETDLSNKVDSATFNSYKSEVQQTQTNYYTKTEINQIADGTGVDGVKVSAVISTSATFDKDGMHYQKSTNDTISTINEEGLSVDDKDNNELFFAGVRAGESTSIVQTSNLKSDTYIIFGNTKGRLQEFTDPDSGIAGVGLFLL